MKQKFVQLSFFDPEPVPEKPQKLKRVRIPTPAQEFIFETKGIVHYNIFSRGDSYSHQGYSSLEAAIEGEKGYRKYFEGQEISVIRYPQSEYYESPEYKAVIRKRVRTIEN